MPLPDQRDSLMTPKRAAPRHAWRLLAALLMALLVTLPLDRAEAQPLGSVGTAPHITAALESESAAPAPGSTTTIALAMQPESGWHGYWKNGGDAGFGTEIHWQLPPGVSVGELRYPVPGTLIIAGLMNHVYEQPYALLAPLTIAPNVAPGTHLTIHAEANWLACSDQICVPERGSFTLELVAGSGTVDAAQQAKFDGWRAAMPEPLGGEALFRAEGGRLRLAIPFPRSMAAGTPHLFIEQQRLNRPAAAQNFSRSGDALIVDMPSGSDVSQYRSFDGILSLGSGRGLAFHAITGAVPPGGAPLGAAASADTEPAIGAFNAALFATALIGAIFGGLILNIMPCVFPILSLKALALARAGGEARHVRAEGIAYTFGAVFVCLGLGLILLLLRAGGEAVGWAFQLQRPESVLLLLVLMSAMTANLAGLFDFASLPVGARLTQAGGTRGAFATGALAAFVATPCSGPFLGSALGATLVLPGWAALPIFGGLGFGLALPFLALALIPALRSRLPRPGGWMETLRRVLAIPMALTVLFLIWLLGRQTGLNGWLVGALAGAATLACGWWAGRLQRRGTPASIALFVMAAMIVPLALLLPQHKGATERAADAQAGAEGDLLHARPWSEAALATARASGKPVFVYFTADWCLSCKVNEAAAINRQETADAFRRAGVTVLVGDWTNADTAITRELARHARNSVPLYLWYPAGGGEPQTLPQILTPAMLAALAAGR